MTYFRNPVVILSLLLVGVAGPAQGAIDQAAKPALGFEESDGSSTNTVRFILDDLGAQIELNHRGMRFRLFQSTQSPSQQWTLQDSMRCFEIEFDGCLSTQPVPEVRNQNHQGINALRYGNVWPGIDARVTQVASGIKYEFILAPGANVSDICLRYDGIEGLALRADGSLSVLLGDPWPELTDSAPIAFQEINGERIWVPVQFELADDRTCKFVIIGNYDRALPLVIDPELTWASSDGGNDIALDSQGNIFFAGTAGPWDWVNWGYDESKNGTSDAFVAKLDATGSPQWTTFVGGDQWEEGTSLALDAGGNIYLTGRTGSSGWVSGSFDNELTSGTLTGFIVKLSGTGSHVWSSYLGEGYGKTSVVTDPAGNVYLGGQSTLPTWPAQGEGNVYAAKFSGQGVHVWSKKFGLNGAYGIQDITLDASGNVLLCGGSNGKAWVSGGFDTTPSSAGDGYLLKLSNSGAHVWSTFLDGAEGHYAAAVVTNSLGDIYVTGDGNDDNFFLAKVTPSGALAWHRSFGNYNSQSGESLALDGQENVYVAGRSSSEGWEIDAFDGELDGGYGFVAKYSPAGSRIWASHLGIGAENGGYGNWTAAYGGNGKLYVTTSAEGGEWTEPSFPANIGGRNIGGLVLINDSPSTGALKVTLNPLEAVAAGAQWRIAGESQWRDSETVNTSVPVGMYHLELRPVTGWTLPASASLTVTPGQTVQAQATLQLNPVGIVWTNYLPETLGNDGDLAVDAHGAIYIAGSTYDAGWVYGGHDTSFGNGRNGTDGYVVKLSSSGEPLWSTYLGGSGDDIATGIATDHQQNVFVTGSTVSPDWIVKPDGDLTSHTADAFVLKLSSSGGLLWSNFLGAGYDRRGNDIAVDVAGNAYAVGTKFELGLILKYGQESYDKTSDLFVTKVSSGGTILWDVFVGGDDNERGNAIAVDRSGKIYVTGSTRSEGWASGGYDTTFYSNEYSYRDAFAAQLSATGIPIWSTYLGGFGDESGNDIFLDNQNNVYVTGYSPNGGWFSGGYDPNSSGGGFLVKLTNAGAHLWSTSLLGSGDGVVVDRQNRVFVAGDTAAKQELNGGFNTLPGGSGYLTKLSDTGANIWSSYVNGVPGSLALDFNDDILLYDRPIVTKIHEGAKGWLRVTIGPQAALNAGARWRPVGTSKWHLGGETIEMTPIGKRVLEFKDIPGWQRPQDIAITVNDTQTAIAEGTYRDIQPGVDWGTYLGGSGNDAAVAIELDATGNVYLTGSTTSSGWVSGGWDASYNGGGDAFVVKIARTGLPEWSTYLGGPNDDAGRSIDVDRLGNVYVAGSTRSAGWITGGFDNVFGGTEDGFVARLTGTGQHAWSTYVGGSGTDLANSLAVDVEEQVHVVGSTTNAGWVAADAQPVATSGSDGFIVKLSASGQKLWARNLRENGFASAAAVEIGDSGNIFATGRTAVGAAAANSEACLIKVAPTGVVVWSEVIKGGSGDSGEAITLDLNENVFLGGRTYAASMSGDLFVAKYNSSGLKQWMRQTGGTADDMASAIAVDKWGSLYVTGRTAGANWITGGFDIHYAGSGDGFMLKLSANGTPLWGTYLGGSSDDQGLGIQVDDSSNIYVCGSTSSAGWITSGWKTATGGGRDGFLAKIRQPTGRLKVTLEPQEAVASKAQWRRVGTSRWLDSGVIEEEVPDGAHVIEFKHIIGWVRPPDHDVIVFGNQTAEVKSAYQLQKVTMEWSTYLGGSADDEGTAVAVGAAGNIIVTGTAYSSGWVSGADSSAHAGRLDGYVVKISPRGNHIWSTFIGGNQDDEPNAVAVDLIGNIYVGGTTNSAGWTHGGYDTIFNGGEYFGDGFVTKLSIDGKHIWSTYVGGASREEVKGLAIDPAGNLLATGWTSSTQWIKDGYQSNYRGEMDGFAVKLSGSGAHLWSTYLGGAGRDEGLAAAADQFGNFYVTGSTTSAGWVSGGYGERFHFYGEDSTFSSDAFVVKLSTAGNHVWSTYVGGGGRDVGQGIAVDSENNVIVGGWTSSNSWASGGFNLGETQYDSPSAFVAKLSGAGRHLWSSFFNGSSAGESVALDSQDRIYLLDHQTFTVNPPKVFRIAPDGKHEWVYPLDSIRSSLSGKLATNPAGDVYVTGTSYDPGWAVGGYDTIINTDGKAYENSDGFLIKLKSQLLGKGNLQVDILPAEAVHDGAKWRRAGTTEWFNSGHIETNLPADLQTLELAEVPGWYPIAQQPVYVETEKTNQFTFTYFRIQRALQVNIEPAAAIAEGAAWQLPGITTWLPSGLIVDPVPPGPAKVAFANVTGWLTPLTRDVPTTPRRVMEVTSKYLPPRVTLEWSSYVGADAYDTVDDVVVDDQGAVYVTGTARAGNWAPVSSLVEHGGSTDVYVMKLNPTGSPLWMTYLGGASSESASGIALDRTGNICIVGTTYSPSWVMNGYNTKFQGGAGAVADYSDGFVAKLSPNGAHLWSSYLGGRYHDSGADVSLDGNENIYAVGYTASQDWVSGGMDTISSGHGDGFIVKVSPEGEHVWSSYVGDAAVFDIANAVIVDPSNDVIVTGSTNHTEAISDTPVQTGSNIHLAIAGPTPPPPPPMTSAFITKVSPLGAKKWTSYFKNSRYTAGNSIAADKQGRLYLTGKSHNLGSYGWSSYYYYGGGFVAAFDGEGEEIWSNVFGNETSNVTVGNAVVLDNSGDLLVGGTTNYEGWISGSGDGEGWQGNMYASSSVFAAKYTTTGLLLWATAMGGNREDEGRSIAVDRADHVYIGGTTNSPDWVSAGFHTIGGGGFLACIHDVPIAIHEPRLSGNFSSSTEIDVVWTSDPKIAGNVFYFALYRTDHSRPPIRISADFTQSAPFDRWERKAFLPDWVLSGQYRLLVVSRRLEANPALWSRGFYYAESGAILNFKGRNAVHSDSWLLFQ